MGTFLQSLHEKVLQAMEIGWTNPTEVLIDWDDARSRWQTLTTGH